MRSSCWLASSFWPISDYEGIKDDWLWDAVLQERAPIPCKEVAKFVHGDYVPQLQANGCQGELLEDIQRRIVTRKEVLDSAEHMKEVAAFAAIQSELFCCVYNHQRQQSCVICHGSIFSVSSAYNLACWHRRQAANLHVYKMGNWGRSCCWHINAVIRWQHG